MHDHSSLSLERSGFTALVALLLAPVIAQGLWRPLVHVFGPAGDAGTITGAALVITTLMVISRCVFWARSPLISGVLGLVVAAMTSVVFSLGVPGAFTLVSVAAGTSFLVFWLIPRLPTSLDGLMGRHKVVAALYGLMALVSVISLARVSIFVGDPTRVDQQALPGEKFVETHSCLTAYVNAATLARQGVDNLYDTRWWAGSHGMAQRQEGVTSPYSPFILDYYAYPPPFLLIMAPLAPLDGDFAAQRSLWFGLNGLLLATGLWLLSRWIGGPNSHRVLLMAPIFFGSLPILVTLQIGNFQIAVVVISVLAMLAFDRGYSATGGALLAFAIMSKISPGVLGIVLLAQRRWKDALFTAGFGAVFLMLSVLNQGIDPIVSFVTYTLPRLSSGETFAFMDDDIFNILTNSGPFGLAFKLQVIGLDVGDPWIVARHVSHVYTLALVILSVIAGRQTGDRRSQVLIWMSLLVLAALQSPFAPGYVVIALLWATTILILEVHNVRAGLALAALWIVATVLPHAPATFLAYYSLLQSIVVIGTPIWLILRPKHQSGTAAAIVA